MNPASYMRSQLGYNYAQALIQDKTILVAKIGTEENPADLGTKYYDGKRIIELLARIGVRLLPFSVLPIAEGHEVMIRAAPVLSDAYMTWTFYVAIGFAVILGILVANARVIVVAAAHRLFPTPLAIDDITVVHFSSGGSVVHTSKECHSLKKSKVESEDSGSQDDKDVAERCVECHDQMTNNTPWRQNKYCLKCYAWVCSFYCKDLHE